MNMTIKINKKAIIELEEVIRAKMYYLEQRIADLALNNVKNFSSNQAHYSMQ